jgi:hypothetical protein
LLIKKNQKMEFMEAMKVNASYEIVAVKENVLVKVPSAGDQHMRWVPAHEIETKNGVHLVEEHYRRGDIFGSRFVTRRFFVNCGLLGASAVVTVKVIEKTDYQKKGQKSYILEIRPTEGSPTSRLKIGSPTGQFPIPGVEGKYINFETM